MLLKYRKFHQISATFQLHLRNVTAVSYDNLLILLERITTRTFLHFLNT